MMDSSARRGQPAYPEGGAAPIKRLGSLAALNQEEQKILNTLSGRTLAAGTLVTAHSADPHSAWFILSGWCGRLSIGSEPDCRVTTLLLPGDGFGIGASRWAGDSMLVRTLTAVVLVDARKVREIIGQKLPNHLRLIEACERAAWLDQIYALNQIKRLCVLNAYKRTAHFYMELYERLNQAGLVRDNAFSLPISQLLIAGVLGLSGSHFNRTLRALKRDKLLEFTRGALRVPDPTHLAKVAEFAPPSISVAP